MVWTHPDLLARICKLVERNTLGVIINLFTLSRSDKTLYLKRRLLYGWSRL